MEFGKKLHSIQFENSLLKVIITDNHPCKNHHRKGYNGIAMLKYRNSKNLFVPFYAGMNFELIFDGVIGSSSTQKERKILFEPRKNKMVLKKLSSPPHLTTIHPNQHNLPTVQLHQPPTRYWKLESYLTFTIHNNIIDLETTFIPHKPIFKNNWFGVFFATYINNPSQKGIYFFGVKAQNKKQAVESFQNSLSHGKELKSFLVFSQSPKHGEKAIYRYLFGEDPEKIWPFKENFPSATMIAPIAFSDYWFLLPLYYGKIENLSLIFLFEDPEKLLFTQSPSGGGENNPAWDWQYRWKDYKLKTSHTQHIRLIVYENTPNPDELIKIYCRWQYADRELIERLGLQSYSQ